MNDSFTGSSHQEINKLRSEIGALTHDLDAVRTELQLQRQLNLRLFELGHAILCATRLPPCTIPINPLIGPALRSEDCIVFFEDDVHHFHTRGPHVSTGFVITYKDGLTEWAYWCDREERFELYVSHKGVAPTHWMRIHNEHKKGMW